MYDSGLVEFQNHSYNMHTLTPRKGIGKKYKESDDEYKTAITNDINKAQEYIKSITGNAPTAFIYPFGEESGSSLEILKEAGFLSTLNCTEKLNYVTKIQKVFMNSEDFAEIMRNQPHNLWKK